MADRQRIEVTVNGDRRSLEIATNVMLLDLLRDTFNRTGAKECCAVGECGACTVVVDGRTVNSCLMLAVEADGKQITTVEGLAEPGELNPLQEAFLDYGAVQCGFCIPGMVMSAQALLDENPNPSVEEVREGLSGNLCRCAGYNRMFEAVLAVSGEKAT
jgi:carbon-monoxide dehydrogenase small subunit